MVEKEETKSVKVNLKIWRELNQIKIDKGFKSIGEVIKFFMKKK